jgi:hypothetical protein
MVQKVSHQFYEKNMKHHQTLLFPFHFLCFTFFACNATVDTSLDTAWLRKRLSSELYHDVMSRPSVSAAADKCTAIAVGIFLLIFIFQSTSMCT